MQRQIVASCCMNKIGRSWSYFLPPSCVCPFSIFAENYSLQLCPTNYGLCLSYWPVFQTTVYFQNGILGKCKPLGWILPIHSSSIYMVPLHKVPSVDAKCFCVHKWIWHQLEKHVQAAEVNVRIEPIACNFNNNSYAHFAGKADISNCCT